MLHFYSHCTTVQIATDCIFWRIMIIKTYKRLMIPSTFNIMQHTSTKRVKNYNGNNIIRPHCYAQHKIWPAYCYRWGDVAQCSITAATCSMYYSKIRWDFTSCFTSSTFSICLARICLCTNSGPLNFLPLNGHNHLSFASSCVFALINFSTSVNDNQSRMSTRITVKY